MENNKLESQWTEYATNVSTEKSNRLSVRPMVMGGMLAATGAAVFSLPSHASASVISGSLSDHLSWNNTAGGQATATLPLSAAPGIKFEGYFAKSAPLLAPQTGNGDVGGAKAFVGNLITNGGPSHGLKKFAFGANITNGANFKFVSGATFPYGAPLKVKSGAANLGSFPINGTQDYFVGMKLSNGDLGYIELAVGNDGTNPSYPDELSIVGYGYNDTPGQSLTAGQTSPVPEASNTATALLLLALAGGSLTSWRKRKQAAA